MHSSTTACWRCSASTTRERLGAVGREQKQLPGGQKLALAIEGADAANDQAPRAEGRFDDLRDARRRVVLERCPCALVDLLDRRANGRLEADADRELPAGAIRLATLVPATVVAATPGLAASARTALGFTLQPTPPSLNEAASIALANARVAGAILICAYAVARCPPARRLLDPLVVLIVLSNAALVGVALGAYGTRALPWLVHLPLEWTAFGLALTRYLAPRPKGRAAIAFLLVAAAAVEVRLTPQP